MKNWKVLKGGEGWRLLTVNKKDLHIYERMLAADVRDTFSLRRNFLLLCEEDATHSPGFIPVNRHPFKVFWSYFAPRSAMSYWPHFVIAARGCSITSLFGTKCTQSAGRSIAKVADLHILPINMSSSGTSSWQGFFFFFLNGDSKCRRPGRKRTRLMLQLCVEEWQRDSLFTLPHQRPFIGGQS